MPDEMEFNGNADEFEPPPEEPDEEQFVPVDPEEMGDWGGPDLEAAYRKALSALDASESEMPSAVPTRSGATDVDDIEESSDHGTSSVVTVTSAVVSGAEPADHARLEALQKELAFVPLVNTTSAQSSVAVDVDERPTPRQIIEVCLFVGGDALTSKKLSGVLRGEFDVEYIDREIDELNRLYAAESRPYEIRLVEGGFRLALREEFERIRRKVYGLGPKEVRLSQDALEVLAVVAYHQPIKQTRVEEEFEKPACGAVLRQLVRRELLAVERDPAEPRDVNYVTTPRFLSLFGIRDLDELPRHEQVSYK